MDYDNLRPIQIVATIWVDPSVDPMEIITEMDYSFDHEAIKDYEIRDVNTEI